jgi:hypothetical protein
LKVGNYETDVSAIESEKIERSRISEKDGYEIGAGGIVPSPGKRQKKAGTVSKEKEIEIDCLGIA